MAKPTVTFANFKKVREDFHKYISKLEYGNAVQILYQMYDDGYIEDVCNLIKQCAISENIFYIGYRLSESPLGKDIIKVCKFEKALEDLLLNPDSFFEISLDHGVPNKLSINGDVETDDDRNAFFHSLKCEQSKYSRMRIVQQ